MGGFDFDVDRVASMLQVAGLPPEAAGALAEIPATTDELIQVIFEAVDVDGNGYVERDELLDSPLGGLLLDCWPELDEDNDEAISWAEFRGFLADLQQEVGSAAAFIGSLPPPIKHTRTCTLIFVIAPQYTSF
jgi:hypothetical protein